MIVIKIELNVLSEDQERVWLTDMGYGEIEDIKRANSHLSEGELRAYIRKINPDVFIRRIDKTSDQSVFQAIGEILPMAARSISAVQNIEYRSVTECQFNTF
jgi:hypothetical protein